MQPPTLLISEIRESLTKKDYDTAKAKCDAALERVKGKQSVPFLIARSTALRFNGKLEEALQDAKVAVSVDPNDPECNICLGQAHLALAAQSMTDGKSKCTSDNHAFSLGRLVFMEAVTSQALTGFKVDGRDPLLLPKETFQQILLLLDSEDRLICTQVNQSWKQQTEGDPTLWRECRFKSLIVLDPLLSFTLKSKHTLVSVDLGFDYSDATELQEVYKSLCKSAATLESLTFRGKLYGTTFTSKAIKLASKCLNLKYLECRISEEAVEFGDRWGNIERLTLDDFKYKSFPEIIKLNSSQSTDIRFGKADLFRSAKSVEIVVYELKDDYMEEVKQIKRSEIESIIRSSADSLVSIDLVSIPRTFYIPPLPKENYEELSLPRLRHLLLKVWNIGPLDDDFQLIDAPNCKDFDGDGAFKIEE